MIAMAIAAGTFGIIGLVFGSIALMLRAVRARSSRRCTAYAQGTVAALESVSGRDGLRAVYEYTAGEAAMIYQSPITGSRPRLAVGQQVDVYYDPQDTSHVFIPEDERIVKALTRVFGYLGAGFLLVALSVLAVLLF